MFRKRLPSPFTIEKLGDGGGHCDCCGRDSRWVAGIVDDERGATVAAYWMRWTVDRLAEAGANLDLVLGPWGEGTGADDRVAVALIHRQQNDGTSELMVVDANGRGKADDSLASIALSREDVIGTPLAAQIFSLVDAIYEQDDRFF